MSRKLVFFIPLLFMTVLITTARSELLVNTGFENGTGEDPDNWWKWSDNWGWAGWTDDASKAHSGDKFVYVGGYESGQYALYGQNLEGGAILPEGTVYTFSAWASTEDWGSPTGSLTVEFKDSVGDNIRVDTLELFDGTINTTWTQYTLVTDPSPAGTVSIQFLCYGGESGTAQFDDISVTPEPGTITMLSLGGLMLLRRRRTH